MNFLKQLSPAARVPPALPAHVAPAPGAATGAAIESVPAAAAPASAGESLRSAFRSDAAPPFAPPAPRTIAETGLDPLFIGDLALKLASTVPHLTTEWAAGRLRLPRGLVEEVFWQLKHDQFVEVLGQTSELDYRYTITQKGRDHARRLMEVSGYVGPAPVSLPAYRAMLEATAERRAKPTLDGVQAALASVVLPEQAVEVAGLSALSGRSLFLFGPPGNGKMSVGRLLHNVVAGGELWVPHCIAVDSSVIRIFDPQVHQPIEHPDDGLDAIDHRWVRVRPPLVVAGGEMTIAELDLAYSPSLRYYEAPPHVKANGGTFLIDDFGRQRVAPHELLNRWIIPLEHRVDHLTLCTGQKIEIPFLLMLIVATNLNISEVADPAFLRRMGYRLHLDKPSPEAYAQIFERYARGVGLQAPPGLVGQLLQRYESEGRELRASEPRDLIERCRDVCTLPGRPPKLEADVMAVAWAAYFGSPVLPNRP